MNTPDITVKPLRWYEVTKMHNTVIWYLLKSESLATNHIHNGEDSEYRFL